MDGKVGLINGRGFEEEEKEEKLNRFQAELARKDGGRYICDGLYTGKVKVLTAPAGRSEAIQPAAA